MQLGDLVRWKPNMPFVYQSDYGIVVEVIDLYLVGVLWFDSDFVYMEAVSNLEVVVESR